MAKPKDPPKINLTKKFIGNGSRLILSDDPDRTYISDGYWMAKRDIFRQHKLLSSYENTLNHYTAASVEESPLRTMQGLIPKFKKPVIYKATRFVWTRDPAWQEGGDDEEFADSRLFVGPEKSQLWVNRFYVKHFKVTHLTAESAPNDVCLSFTTDTTQGDWRIIIMPMNQPYAKDFSQCK